MAVANWREYLAGLVPQFLRGYWGSRFVGVIGLMADSVATGAAEALRVSWLLESTSPDDALPLDGSEKRMPRYPLETAASHRARLVDAWNAYEHAGLESAILSQLTAAGYPGCTIEFDSAREGPHGEAAPYLSQFWVRFPVGVCSPGSNWDSFNWDDGTAWDTSLSFAAVSTLRSIVNHWKPADWCFRGMLFAQAVGDDFEVDNF
jgi:hypothetical protein